MERAPVRGLTNFGLLKASIDRKNCSQGSKLRCEPPAVRACPQKVELPQQRKEENPMIRQSITSRLSAPGAKFGHLFLRVL